MTDHRLVFTKHAVERYIQFHMIGAITPPDPRDVRALLESHAPQAYKILGKTHCGHPQWRIDALGCDLVAKHDDGENIVVTILPPERMRGLTPAEAERLAEHANMAKARAATLAAEQAALTETARALKTKPAKADKPAIDARNNRLAELKHERIVAEVERDVILHVLKKARQQLADEDGAAKLKMGLRIALRHLRSLGDAAALAEVATVDARFVTDKFIDKDQS